MLYFKKFPGTLEGVGYGKILNNYLAKSQSININFNIRTDTTFWQIMLFLVFLSQRLTYVWNPAQNLVIFDCSQLYFV